MGSYSAGIDFGTTYSAAAICREGRTEIVELGARSAVVPTAVYLRPDGTVITGEAAMRRAVEEPERSAREFKRRLGDPTPLIVGGAPWSAEGLTARVLRTVFDYVTAREGGPPDHIGLSHPANWGPYKQDLLRQAAVRAGIGDAQLVTEPQAAAIAYSSLERVKSDSAIAVYDLGGGTFDAAILRKTRNGFVHLGRPEGIERLGGIDFDEAVYAHVKKAVPVLATATATAEAASPDFISAVLRLRAECTAAKEALSADTDTIIPVNLPGHQGRVRIVRAEFEAMIKPAILETIQALRRALTSAELTPEDVSVVLLAGGSSRIPLVAQLVSELMDRPIAVDAHPKHLIAVGAALATAPLVPKKRFQDSRLHDVPSPVISSPTASTRGGTPPRPPQTSLRQPAPISTQSRSVSVPDGSTRRPQPLDGNSSSMTRAKPSEESRTSSQASFLVSCGADETVKVWNLRSEARLNHTIIGHDESVNAICTDWIHGQPFIASAGMDECIRLWDPLTGSSLGDPLVGHFDGVSALTTSRINSTPVLVSGSFDHSIIVWDLETREMVGEPIRDHDGPVLRVATARIAGRPIAVVGDAEGRISTWDLETGAAAFGPKRGNAGPVRSLAVGRRNGRHVAIIGNDTTVDLLDGFRVAQRPSMAAEPSNGEPAKPAQWTTVRKNDMIGDR
ncbi:MAG: Hsp70 family protein, partial [Pseudonocardia sp.]